MDIFSLFYGLGFNALSANYTIHKSRKIAEKILNEALPKSNGSKNY
jgi:hypothetical protein